MQTARWIALVIVLLGFALVAWIVLTLLWLTGRIAQRIAFKDWRIRKNLLRWTIASALVAILAAFSGFYLSEIARPFRGATDDEISAYIRDVVKQSLITIFYAITFMAVHVIWSYACLVVGLLTGKYPVKQNRDE